LCLFVILIVPFVVRSAFAGRSPSSSEEGEFGERHNSKN